MSKRVSPWLAVVVAVVGMSACTSTRQALRSDIQLIGEPSQVQDGLTLAATVLDMAAIKNDPRLFRQVDVLRRNSAGGDPVAMKVGWTVLSAPVFQVKVVNNTGHVINMNGAVFKLIDSAGNLHDAVSKDKLKAENEVAVGHLAGSGISVPQASLAQLNGAVNQLKLLDENTQLLPDIAETFYLSFQLPVDPTEEALNNWLAQQKTLRLKIYNVPTKTNEAGAVAKRVAFEFPIDVKTFRETYEVNMLGAQTLVATEEIAK